MNTEEYCENLCNELVKWRNEIHKENEKIGHYPSADKLHMQAVVEDLRMLETEMDDRIHQLKTECPIAWEPEHADQIIEPGGSISKFAVGEDESEKYIGEGNFGG